LDSGGSAAAQQKTSSGHWVIVWAI
jgi:hypothetical protein